MAVRRGRLVLVAWATKRFSPLWRTYDGVGRRQSQTRTELHRVSTVQVQTALLETLEGSSWTESWQDCPGEETEVRSTVREVRQTGVG